MDTIANGLEVLVSGHFTVLIYSVVIFVSVVDIGFSEVYLGESEVEILLIISLYDVVNSSSKVVWYNFWVVSSIVSVVDWQEESSQIYALFIHWHTVHRSSLKTPPGLK